LVVYEEWHVKIIMPLDGVFSAIDVKTKQPIAPRWPLRLSFLLALGDN